MKRRKFLKQTTFAGTAALLSPLGLSDILAETQENYFAVHQFIENNPDAVFIMRTNVDSMQNTSAIKDTGFDFSSSVFQHTADPAAGVPLTHNFAMKPNLTSRGKWMAGYTVEGTRGVITDVNFVEGIIGRMTELGIPPAKIFIREVNGAENLTEGGYGDMAARTGIDVKVAPNPLDSIPDEQVQWRDVPDGVFFKNLPYLWPINSPDSWLLNVSKFKAHSMGMTLCAKNMQGSTVARYQQYCHQSMSISDDHKQPGSETVIADNYARHVADGVPRWDTPLTGLFEDSGLGQETWATRCCDNHSVIKPGLHVVEGIYGRDGHFVFGPHDGLAQDFLTNVIIFGKNAFHVDVVGSWLGGHEPGNFGLFHLALERGLSNFLNPMDIPVYEWKADTGAELKALSEFQRTPLKTRYLKQTDEAEWHLCDQEYNYPTSIQSKNFTGIADSYKLFQNYPNPFNSSTTIQFRLEKNSHVRIEIFNNLGKIAAIPLKGFYQAGAHMVTWDASNFPSGHYYCRLSMPGYRDTKRMVLLK